MQNRPLLSLVAVMLVAQSIVIWWLVKPDLATQECAMSSVNEISQGVPNEAQTGIALESQNLASEKPVNQINVSIDYEKLANVLSKYMETHLPQETNTANTAIVPVTEIREDQVSQVKTILNSIQSQADMTDETLLNLVQLSRQLTPRERDIIFDEIGRKARDEGLNPQRLFEIF